MDNKTIDISIIIPVYNEMERLQNIDSVYSYLSRKSFSSEVILVDDGSSSTSKQILLEYQKKYAFLLISYNENKGKGYAVRKGMLAAKGASRIFLDVDLSTPIDTIDTILPLLDSCPVIIGSRKMTGANILLHQSFIREKMGKFFTSLSRMVLGMHISDFTCGFKSFSGEASEKIFTKARIDRWGFDSEIMFLAKKFGYPIKEIPVTWKDEKHTTVKFPQDIIRSLIELFSIRWNDLLGKYE